MTAHLDVPLDIVERVRSICLVLPEAYEETAWIGARWRVRKGTFAHVLMIDSGRPAAYARAARSEGPLCILTFQSSGSELERLRAVGHPYFGPVWRPGIIGMAIATDTGWEEVGELLTESYCTLAPKALLKLVVRPTR